MSKFDKILTWAFIIAGIALSPVAFLQGIEESGWHAALYFTLSVTALLCVATDINRLRVYRKAKRSEKGLV